MASKSSEVSVLMNSRFLALILTFKTCKFVHEHAYNVMYIVYTKHHVLYSSQINPLTSVVTFVLGAAEFWLTATVGPIEPPVANCMLRAAARDFTVDELLSGGETLMLSF